MAKTSMTETREQTGTPDPGGRPTKYNEDMFRMAEHHVEWCAENGKLPTRRGLALRMGVCFRTIHNWEAKYPQFAAACEQIHLAQHEELVNDGLQNKKNAALVKMTLMSHHGYTERTKTDNTSRNQDAPPITDEEWREYWRRWESAGTGLDTESISV